MEAGGRTHFWNVGRACFATLLAMLCTAGTGMAFALLALSEHVGLWPVVMIFAAFWVVAWHRLGQR